MSNDEAWHAYRLKGLGSSDAPVVMGVSPYSTLYKLWEIKTGRATHEVNNWATQRGTAMEPIARAHYELMTGYAMPAACLVHAGAPWLRASLDGYNGCHVLEIKCPGKVDHVLALGGQIPEKYYPQLQHQLIVSGASHVDYFSFDGKSGVIVRVELDEDWVARYIEKAYEFWWKVEQDIPPEIGRGDYKGVRSKELNRLLKVWQEDPRAIFVKAIMQIANGQRLRTGHYLIDGVNETIVIRRRHSS